jgi:hypothetical protein
LEELPVVGRGAHNQGSAEVVLGAAEGGLKIPPAKKGKKARRLRRQLNKKGRSR